MKKKLDNVLVQANFRMEPICSLVGMNAYSGCRSYSFLSPMAQKLVRLWTMSERDRANRRLIRFIDAYSDRLRHRQLLNSYSRFCCRTMRTSASSSNHYSLLIFAILFIQQLLS
uniref:Uncharacterized protein n=1 Tax=Ascaris lumbricoides TaxID=6252 RepID=A0A0M3IS34_ASCLU